MNSLYGKAIKWLKIILLLIVGIELISFLAITIHNYLLYGNPWSHVPVRFDSYTFFLMQAPNPPSQYNRSSTHAKLNRRIWMFGGSTVRSNAHLDENKTLPAYLAYFLNKSANPLCYSVKNLGENGFNSHLESQYLKKLLSEGSPPPNLIIFYDGANDSFQFAEYRQPVSHIGYRRLKGFIESYRSSFFGLLRPINAAWYTSYTKEFIDKIRLYHIPVQSDSPILKEMVSRTVQRYDYVAKVAKCYSAEFLLIWQPMIWVEDCSQSEKIRSQERTFFLDTKKFERMKQSVTVTYSALEKVLVTKPYFKSMRTALCNRQQPYYRPDGLHLKPLGRRSVAKMIVQIIREKCPYLFKI